MPAATHLDHLVVIAATLEQGEQWLHATCGVMPQPGGKHALMGTHNALLRVSESVYLEIIAIDPTASPLPRRRWFDMDNPARLAQVRQAPQLAHFVVRSTNVSASVLNATYEPGTILDLARGNFRWRITVTEDGALPEHGLLPTIIEWQTTPPIEVLPASAVRLLRLTVRHPDPTRLLGCYRSIALRDLPELEMHAQPQLAATLQTPRGEVTLTGNCL